MFYLRTSAPTEDLCVHLSHRNIFRVQFPQCFILEIKIHLEEEHQVSFNVLITL